MDDIKYWWVSQGKTWKLENEGGFLWAPYENSSGRSFWHWDTMDELKKGDFVFSYVHGKIIAVSKVSGPSYKSQKPKIRLVFFCIQFNSQFFKLFSVSF